MNIKRFIKICKMSQDEVKKYATKRLNTTHGVYMEDGFVYAKGTFPVLLVAHMDTVHKKRVHNVIRKNGSISSPQGIGGDDRCGIYMVLEIAKHWNCHVLFCEDEEIGGVGANKFVKSKHAKSLDVNYIVELDRRGSTDAVFYDCDNQAFTDFVCKEYFKEAWGTFSDISVIAPSVGVSAVNLSSGYHNAHTEAEYVVEKEVDRIIEEVEKLLDRTDNSRYEYVERKVDYSRYYDYDKWYSRDFYYGYTGYTGNNANSKTDAEDEENYFEIEYMCEDGQTGYEYVEATSREQAEYEFLVYNPTIPYGYIIDVRNYGKVGAWK